MRKIITCILMLVAFSFCSIANAGVMEDVQKLYPKIKIEETTILNEVGAEVKKKSMTIHKEDIFGLNLDIRLLTLGEENIVCFDYHYSGGKWRFLNKASVGNGKELIVLEPAAQPTRKVISARTVYEYLMMKPSVDQLQFMKNTKVMRVHSDRESFMVEINRTKKHHVPYFEALDYAIKFLNE